MVCWPDRAVELRRRIEGGGQEQGQQADHGGRTGEAVAAQGTREGRREGLRALTGSREVRGEVGRSSKLTDKGRQMGLW